MSARPLMRPMCGPLDYLWRTHIYSTQDISLFCCGQKVDRSPRVSALAEIRAAFLVPATLDRRLCILGRYVPAVLTASSSPTAPIQSIETEGVHLAPSRVVAVQRHGHAQRPVLVGSGRSGSPLVLQIPSSSRVEGISRRSQVQAAFVSRAQLSDLDKRVERVQPRTWIPKSLVGQNKTKLEVRP